MNTTTTTTTVGQAVKAITRIIVHPGIFHADDVFACAWLRHLGCDAPVDRRVPTPEELEDPAVLVADIGGRHEPALMNFDHHQRGGAGERWDTSVPFAAFGLVYQALSGYGQSPVADRFDETLVQPIDALDNGFGAGASDSTPRCSLSAAVSSFNPGPSTTAAERDAAFEEAVKWVRPLIQNFEAEAVRFVAARDEVLAAPVEDAVLVLGAFVPWGEHVFARPDQAGILFAVFPSERGGWMVQQVPAEAGSFAGRLPLPEAWAGLRGAELQEECGVPDAVFVHPGRFCGGADTLEGVKEMALRAIATT